MNIVNTEKASNCCKPRENSTNYVDATVSRLVKAGDLGA